MLSKTLLIPVRNVAWSSVIIIFIIFFPYKKYRTQIRTTQFLKMQSYIFFEWGFGDCLERWTGLTFFHDTSNGKLTSKKSGNPPVAAYQKIYFMKNLLYRSLKAIVIFKLFKLHVFCSLNFITRIHRTCFF